MIAAVPASDYANRASELWHLTHQYGGLSLHGREVFQEQSAKSVPPAPPQPPESDRCNTLKQEYTRWIDAIKYPAEWAFGAPDLRLPYARPVQVGILEYASDEIERTLVAMLNEYEQQLFKYAEQARSNLVQTRWLEAQRLVKRTRPDLVPRFLIALEAELATIKDPAGARLVIGGPRVGRGELKLVENLDLDEATVLSEIAGRAEVRNSLPLYLLGQRFGVLAGKPAFDSENLPIGPQAANFVLRGGLAPGQVLASIPTGGPSPIFTFVAPTGSFFIRLHGQLGSDESPASN